MIKEGAEGNEAFDGFAIDLLKAISEYLGFKVSSETMAAFKQPKRSHPASYLKPVTSIIYVPISFQFKLYTVPDSLYGFYNHETGQWNGIVRQLTDKRADLAVASMTINYARETAIDFTKPFMNLGISILFKAPKPPAAEVRS